MGHYFFAGFCSGRIRKLDPESGAIYGFVTGLKGAVDLKMGKGGSLY